FLEGGIAAADHGGFGVVTGAQGNPRGSIAGIEPDRFLQQFDGLFVVLDVVGGILAAEVEIVGLLVLWFGGGEFSGGNAERRKQPFFERGGDVVVEFENVS